MKGCEVIRTVSQYSRILPKESIELLMDLADGCQRVKNYVYGRYCGIKSIEKLTPGYDIANEMRHLSLRNEIGLPSVYYELAVFDAIKDIKSMWENLKNKIRELIKINQNLTQEDKRYIRTVLKLDFMYISVLLRKDFERPENSKSDNLNYKRLDNLICRLTRRYKKKLSARCNNIISIKSEAYKYADGGIYVATKAKRKRLFIPLRDERVFSSQMLVIIREDYIELKIPVEVKIKRHEDFVNTIFASIGYRDMLTLSNGNIYGRELNKYVSSETDRLTKKNKNRSRVIAVYIDSMQRGDSKKALKIQKNNMGKKKYGMEKRKNAEKTHTFINSEINRMFKEEKPAKIVIVNKLKPNLTAFSKKVRNKLSRSFDGYIRERLKFKCAANGIELVQISPRNIAGRCCRCSAEGAKQGNLFFCPECGLKMPIALNSAKNIENKYKQK